MFRLSAILIAALATACIPYKVVQVTPSDTVEGVRYYESLPWALVQKDGKATVIWLQDRCRAMEVQLKPVVGKSTVAVTVSNGMLASVNGEADASGVFEPIGAIGAAAVPLLRGEDDGGEDKSAMALYAQLALTPPVSSSARLVPLFAADGCGNEPATRELGQGTAAIDAELRDRLLEMLEAQLEVVPSE